MDQSLTNNAVRQKHLVLPAGTHAELKRIAKAQGRTMTALIERALPLLEALR